MEICILLKEINNWFPYGRFEPLEAGGSRIRSLQKVDFERAAPNGRSMENIVGPGRDKASFFSSRLLPSRVRRQLLARPFKQ